METKLDSNSIISLLESIENRFKNNMHRHKNIDWNEVKEKIKKDTIILSTLIKMENSGGEPDIVTFTSDRSTLHFIDCAKESPIGRRSLCYDKKAFLQRKKNKPSNDAISLAKDIGVEILTEDEYYKLQSLENFDTKTSSWVKTPTSIRELGGAIFCDNRYGRVFTYHNGADSYYASRGFRGKISFSL